MTSFSSLRSNRGDIRWIAILIVLALIVLISSAFFGSYRVSLADFFNTVRGQAPAPMTEFFVLERRLPRAAVALCAGMLLAASGSLTQQLLRNPLASPDIIGITTGASFGGAMVILLLGGSLASASLGAAAGAIMAALILIGAVKVLRLSGSRLILLGVGLAALATALTNYLLTQVFVPSAEVAQTWLVGSLQGRGKDELVWLLAGVAILLITQIMFGIDLKMLQMGDDLAAGLGVHVTRTRLVLLFVAALLAALAVVSCGPIGFISLVAPHISFALTKSRNLISCGLTGGILLVVSDLVAQYAFSVSLPVGVITVVFGGGFFLWLLFRQRRIHG